jgi:carboxymethylenebutenolidase
VTDVAAIQAAVLSIFSALDTRIDHGIAPIEEAMKANGKTFEKIVYTNADQPFHNDIGTGYNPVAATDV